MSDITVNVAPPAQLKVTFSQQQGIAGPPGSIPPGVTVETTALVDGEQTIALPSPLSTGWCLLCINGLRQATTAYSVTGSVLTLPADLNVLTGDLISFDYYPIH